MIRLLGGLPPFGVRGVNWIKMDPRPDGEGLKIHFRVQGMWPKGKFEETIADALSGGACDWMRRVDERWSIDLDGLKDDVNLPNWPWFTGTAYFEAEVEYEENPLGTGYGNRSAFHTNFWIILNPETLKRAKSPTMFDTPPEIMDSLRRFQSDYPDPTKVAFLIMRFGTTKAHSKSETAIRKAFADHGITVLRADDAQYHDDLFPNVRTYMHGCGMAVALFERIEVEEFNPNVSLEVGYMMAMGKPVCLLKDRTLRALHTDLVGKLYKSFDPQAPAKTIEPEIEKWLKDRGLA